MTATLKLEWPDHLQETLQAAGYTPERISEEALATLAADLFQRRILTLEQAANLARAGIWDFISYLGTRGIAVADYDEVEARNEVETGQWLAKNPRK